MCGRIGYDRVARREQRAKRAKVRLLAGGVDDAIFAAHPCGKFGFKLRVKWSRAVQQS